MDEPWDALEQALDRIETAFNAMHPGDYTEDELHGLAQGLWFGAEEIRTALAAAPAADSRGLDVERVMDAEHRYCVQVEGEWALGHEVERHRAQAEFIIARLTDPEPAT